MCRDEIANNFVERGEVFLRLSPTTGQQEGCTCGVGGVSVPGSCVGPETTAVDSTAASTTTTAAVTTGWFLKTFSFCCIDRRNVKYFGYSLCSSLAVSFLYMY